MNSKIINSWSYLFDIFWNTDRNGHFGHYPGMLFSELSSAFFLRSYGFRIFRFVALSCDKASIKQNKIYT